MNREIEVHGDLGGQTQPVGRLWSRVIKGRESASFEYAPSWLASPVRFALEPARLESLLSEVVPRMTNQTLAQDPAEFRRKFKGLRQLYLRSHAVYSPGGTRAGDAASSA